MTKTNEEFSVKTDQKYLDHYFKTEEISKKIYHILTSNKFSRDDPTLQMDIKENIRDQLLDAIGVDHQCISIGPLVGLWGGTKENKTNEADQADIIALDYLGELRELVNKETVKPGLELTLLFCDWHHIIANKRSLEESRIYFESLKKLTEERQIKTVNLSQDVYKLNQIHFFYNPLDYISDKQARMQATEVCSNKNAFDKLVDASKKHSLWVKEGIVNPQKIAKLYVEMECYFLNRIKDQYKNPILFSFSDPDIQKPIAEAVKVPMLYFHASGKGHHECPWYVAK